MHIIGGVHLSIVTRDWLFPYLHALLFYLFCAMHSTMAQPLSQPISAAPRWMHLADPVFAHLGTEQGLPNPLVTTLAEDASGFIWVGTQGGLARWDGYRFRVYQPDPKDATSLPDNYIRALHTDSNGRLWVGTMSGGLARYDVQHDRFVRYGIVAKGAAKDAANAANAVSHASVYAIADDGSGGVWLATLGGLDHLLADGTIKHLRLGDKPHETSPNTSTDSILSLLRDRAGRLWVGSDKGLALQDGKSERFIPVNLPIAPGSVPSILSLAQSDDGKVWIGSRQHGVFVIDAAGADGIGAAQVLLDTDEKSAQGSDARPRLARTRIFSIAQAKPNEIWIGSYSDGLTIVDSATLQTRHIRQDAALKAGIPNNTIWTILRDRAGLMWLGTNRGLSRHDGGQSTFLSLFGDPSRTRRIVDPDITAIATTPDGRAWLGLQGGGVNIIDAAAQQVAWLAPNANTPETALPSVTVLASTVANDKTLLIGTERGLYQIDLLGLQVRRVAMPPRDAAGDARALLMQGSTLWLGSVKGLWQVELENPATGQSHYAQAHAKRPLGARLLETQTVTVLAEAGDGAVWLGTGSSGVYRYDPASQKLLQLAAKPDDKNALSHNYIASLLFDRRGRLWVATLGGGINLLEKPDAKASGPFIHIASQQGLPNDNVNKLLEDAQGRIWASTDAGLAVIEPDSLAVRALGAADGVAVSAYWLNSGAKTARGELLFGGDVGLTVVRPENLKTWAHRPKVVVTDVQLGGVRVNSSQFNQALGTSPKPAANDASLKNHRLIISPEVNSIAVEFSSLDYSASQQNRYAYRLDGYDKDWINTDWTKRLAAYTNLPPGDYQLRLRGSNRDGVWTEQEVKVPLKVLPAWYQTWWFRLSEVLAAAAAVYAVVQGRTRYLRQRQLELEGQVQHRTEQLQQKQIELLDANEELNQSNSALNDANSELLLSVETLRQLGDIGRDITANLDAQTVFEALYQYVGGLLNAHALMIYRMNANATALDLVFGREDGQALPASRIALDSPTSNAARAVRERQDLLLNFAPDEIYPSHIPGTRLMLTSMFSPLIVDDQVLGVLSIQSDQAHAYGERERLIFRTLSAYGAIALANAEAMAALHAAQAQLVQQEKMASLGNLVGGVAHEINTPLGNTIMAISCSAESWQRLREAVAAGRVTKSLLDSSTAEGVEYTDMALKTSARVAALIATFKTIAVPADSDSSEVDLSSYLPAVANLFKAQLLAAGHSLTLDVEPDLKLHTVHEALTEALTRILSNVLDHAFTARSNGVLCLSAKTVNNEGGSTDIMINVADNGVGIAAQDLPKVFDPFFTTKRGIEGHVGLGLHVAFNHVTQRLKGRISIASSEGEGTTVTICLASSDEKMAAHG